MATHSNNSIRGFPIRQSMARNNPSMHAGTQMASKFFQQSVSIFSWIPTYQVVKRF
ncbi:hypothetical protein MPTK1_6g01790 [Marchantia polymorpha subsp. ruderalis]|uniref:Uncharacterized protein n=2 Tax=Marchantia polymorpha TaxID=3197 RepID=A0AAF6BMI9_MARPO|nr:hypothetical protein MARPO_0052s0025 [Marchantia polymorpha]BBN13223.1 hypothetical protein Mp_6g01790 [Marchantia polymorpha subsp. ruderalis]|eukprot:PTQ38222.1 hypothetical protein MARPO_0052s0025 [Marchantia polymorpha]